MLQNRRPDFSSSGRRYLLTLWICVLLIPAGRVWGLENFNGSLRLLGTSNKIDSVKSESLDQQFNLNYNRALLPYLTARLSLNYQTLQTYQKPNPDHWHQELGPSGDLFYSNPLFSAGANYRYWQVRDRVASNNSLSRSTGIYLRTKFVNLPQSNLQFDWNRLASNSGYTPLDNEEKRFSYNSSYSYGSASAFYGYSNRFFKNRINEVSEKLKQHIFRFDYGNNFFHQRLRVSGDYLFTSTRREENNGTNLQTLIQLAPVVGLYKFDDTPEIGALDTLAELIDNNLTDPTSPVIDIGGVQVDKNIGFDLGLPRTISQIYIITDRQSGDQVSWKVYISDDNLQWSSIEGASPSTFNLSYKRYEIIFSATQSRYFKVVNSGLNDQVEVYVTEIQAFMNSGLEGTLPNKTQNHQVSANVSYKILTNLQTTIDGLWGTTLENNTGLQRKDLNVTGTISYKPSSIITTVGRYRHSITNYQSNLVLNQKSDIYSVHFLANPLKTVELSLSGSHSDVFENNLLDQKLNSALFHTSALLLPKLSVLTEVEFSRNERPQENSSLDSWTYRVAADASPYQNLNVVINYTQQIYSTALAYLSGRRHEIDVYFTGRLTSSLFLRGEWLYNKESTSENLLQDYSLSWNLTDRISADFGVRQQETFHINKTQSLNLQANYAFSTRSNTFIAITNNKISGYTQQKTTSLQAGLNTSF
ncbi:MAG: hypothetical protein NTW14_00320 [bacterium]|nr:hypothetical protein [bacterium]